MRFDSGISVGYGRRCRFNHVQVLVCRPVSMTGRLFPTTFWLTCPFLIHRAGMIESHQGVHELEEYMTGRKLFHEWRRYNLIHQSLRLSLISKHKLSFMRRFQRNQFRHLINTGIGGIAYSERINVKCLHLQTASFLALRFHPAEEWLRDKGLNTECEHNICINHCNNMRTTKR